MRAHPIPASIASLLDDNGLLLRTALTEQQQKQREAQAQSDAAECSGVDFGDNAAMTGDQYAQQADLSDLSEVRSSACRLLKAQNMRICQPEVR